MAAAPFHGLGALEPRAIDPTAGNWTKIDLEILCAWPVSGQYGPGTRILFYILVLGCVVGKNYQWLRNVCLAAALVVSAVAAIHGITLAIVHQPDAVDLDIYGALQLVSIGILAAPVTVRISRTYFRDPGRNMIFLWTALLLAGLMALTVEFFRVKLNKTHCRIDTSVTDPFDAKAWDYDSDEKCGLICIESDKNGPGPFSPIRVGATGELVVIPVPTQYSLSMGILISAGCSVPAVLMLISTWLKIREENRARQNRGLQFDDEFIEGTNGATVGHMKTINQSVREMLRVVELLVFTLVIAALLVIGEMNFWSDQLQKGAEPITSVGQWGPIAGTVTAAIGSLYLVLAREFPRWLRMDDAASDSDVGGCACTCCGHRARPARWPPNGDNSSPPPMPSPIDAPASTHAYYSPSGENNHGEDFQSFPEMTSAVSPDPEKCGPGTQAPLSESKSSRGRAAKFFLEVNRKLGTAAPSANRSGFAKRGRAWPEIPGERQRNFKLYRQKTSWKKRTQEVRVHQQLERSRASSVRMSTADDGGGRSRTSSRSPRQQPTSPGAGGLDSDGNISPLARSSTVDFVVPNGLRHSESSPSGGGLTVPANTYRSRSPRRGNTLPVPPSTLSPSSPRDFLHRMRGMQLSSPRPSLPPIHVTTAEPIEQEGISESPTTPANPTGS